MLDYWRRRYDELSKEFWAEMRDKPLPPEESQAKCFLRMAIFNRIYDLDRQLS